MSRADLKNLPPAKVHFIEPMYAKAVQDLPEGSEWIYEIKLDGYRTLNRQRLERSEHLVS